MSSEPIKCPKGLCRILASSFKMGSTNGSSDERPVHTVKLSEYSMKKHPVTVRQYRTYLLEKEVARFQFQAVIRPASMPKLPEGFDGDDQPMVQVNWREARSYCQFYGMDLPTEAQWERGARGLSGDKEYGTWSGRLSQEEAHYNARTTAPVCSKPENDLGLCDMAGQVWEWTLDWYQQNAYKTMAAKDPQGPPNGKHHGKDKVIRGGSWRDEHSSPLHAYYRFTYPPLRRNDKIGFRCVAAPKESKK